MSELEVARVAALLAATPSVTSWETTDRRTRDLVAAAGAGHDGIADAYSVYRLSPDRDLLDKAEAASGDAAELSRILRGSEENLLTGRTLLEQWWRQNIKGVPAPEAVLVVERLRVATSDLTGEELEPLYAAAAHVCPTEAVDLLYKNLARSVGYDDTFGVLELDRALESLRTVEPWLQSAAVQVDRTRSAFAAVGGSLPEQFRLGPVEAARLSAGQVRPAPPRVGPAPTSTRPGAHRFRL